MAGPLPVLAAVLLPAMAAVLALGTPQGTLARACTRASPSSGQAGTVACACDGGNHSSRPSLRVGEGEEAAPLKARLSAALAALAALAAGPAVFGAETAGENDNCVFVDAAVAPVGILVVGTVGGAAAVVMVAVTATVGAVGGADVPGAVGGAAPLGVPAAVVVGTGASGFAAGRT